MLLQISLAVVQICIVIRKRERRFLKGSCNKINKDRKKGREEERKKGRKKERDKETKKKEREKKERDRKKLRNKDESEE